MLRRAKQINEAFFPQFDSLKSGRLTKVVHLFVDYKRSLLDAWTYIRTKPVKVTLQSSLVGITTWAYFVNPDLTSYHERLINASNNHSLISDMVRNKSSSQSVLKVMEYYSQDRLKRVNLGICSLILLQPVSGSCDVFEKHCSAIQSRWIKKDDWKSRVVDFGFAGKWIYLDSAMNDFDVNDDEFL